jgi:hypothetical protein
VEDIHKIWVTLPGKALNALRGLVGLQIPGVGNDGDDVRRHGGFRKFILEQNRRRKSLIYKSDTSIAGTGKVIRKEQNWPQGKIVRQPGWGR